jgi:hypothetical protein
MPQNTHEFDAILGGVKFGKKVTVTLEVVTADGLPIALRELPLLRQRMVEVRILDKQATIPFDEGEHGPIEPGVTTVSEGQMTVEAEVAAPETARRARPCSQESIDETTGELLESAEDALFEAASGVVSPAPADVAPDTTQDATAGEQDAEGPDEAPDAEDEAADAQVEEAVAEVLAKRSERVPTDDDTDGWLREALAIPTGMFHTTHRAVHYTFRRDDVADTLKLHVGNGADREWVRAVARHVFRALPIDAITADRAGTFTVQQALLKKALGIG